MKNLLATSAALASLFMFTSCNQSAGNQEKTMNNTHGQNEPKGQSAVQDDMSAKNVVQVAMGSTDHTTLVTAIKTAELVDALSNAGPFTVFAPTNAAFDKLPKGTVASLLTPEKKPALTDILQYHVSVGVFKTESLQDGQSIGQVNGGNIKIQKKDGKIVINGKATIVASIPASNGIIHVIDEVLLPE